MTLQIYKNEPYFPEITHAQTAGIVSGNILQRNMKQFTAKQFLYTVLLLIGSTVSANATVLFPFFVDIAPNYEEGITKELQAAGVTCGMYHSTKPGFMVSNFTEVEDFFKDTLPSDVSRSEKKVGKCLLVVYTSVNPKNDTIKTKALRSTIYVLRRPDNSFAAGYCEQEVELETATK